MIPENIMTVQSPFLVPIITVASNPKDLQIDHETTSIIDETCTLLTAHNNGLLNSFNTVQL